MQRQRLSILGLFVIVAFLVICFTVIAFMPRYSLDYSQTYVVYFQGQQTGLDVGSPVTIRGIKVGQVTDIHLQFDKQTNQFNVPVYINFFKRRTGKLADHSFIEGLIHNGLRAELNVQNLITGNAAIEIEFRPGSKGYVVNTGSKRYIEIPSVPDNEQSADLSTAINAARDMFNSIETLAKSPKVDKTLAAVTNAANGIKTLSSDITDQVPSITAHFNDGVNELKNTAYSVRTLSEYLSRHPEALIKGKRPNG